jgi:chromosome transmission fidelity protein 1
MSDAQRVSRSATPADTHAALLYDTAMKLVNQSIGRALRHRDDYAAILLVDERYRQIELERRLPTWLQRSLPTVRDASFGDLQRRLTKFFVERAAVR